MLPTIFRIYRETNYSDWVDSFYAKDVQEMFSIEKRSAFLRFCEANGFATPCGVSHSTIAGFILKLRGRPPIAIECKSTAKEFNPAAILNFRKIHGKGKNFVVTLDTLKTTVRRIEAEEFHFTSLQDLNAVLALPEE